MKSMICFHYKQGAEAGSIPTLGSNLGYLFLAKFFRNGFLFERIHRTDLDGDPPKSHSLHRGP
jgi:hypothetical protein